MASHNQQKHIVIIGGGISGLSAAWEVQQRGQGQIKLTVLESDSRWGGKVLTQRMTGPDGGEFIIDAGPESFVTRKPEAWQLALELELEEQLINPGSDAAGTFVLNEGRPMRLPLSPGAFIRSPLLSTRGKLRMLREPFVPAKRDGADESLADFVTRRLGRQALEKFIGPVLGGIYNTDPETQSILVTSPIMRELEQHGSLVRGTIARMRERRRESVNADRPPHRFIGFAPGAEILIDTLIQKLHGDLRLNALVTGLETDGAGGVRVLLADDTAVTADAVIVATPANVAARLLMAVSPASAQLLSQIRHVNIGTISLAYRDQDVAHTAHIRGLMVPRREGRRIDAITWTSGKIAGRAPDGYALIRVFFGGGYPEAATMPQADLLEVVRAELKDLLQIEAAPLDYRVASWPDSYPQADVGHLERVAALEASLPLLFYVTGSSYRGLAVPDCIKQSRNTAVQALSALGLK